MIHTTKNILPVLTRAMRGTTLPAALLFLGLISAPPSNAEPLGRLFFTPEQRMQFENAHTSSIAAKQGSPSALIINGIVQKRGGPRTVWVNGKARDEGYSGDRTPESLTLTVPGKTNPVRAKVGQKILLDQPATAAEKK